MLLRIPNWVPYLSVFELTEYRFIIRLAEALYSAWTGAYSALKVDKDLLSMCPYDLCLLDWDGHVRALSPPRRDASSYQLDTTS
jgi:hypothetical protein